jgi:hypothetical protein
MGLEGLKIEEPTDFISEAKITPNSIWIHVVEPKNFGNINEHSQAFIKRVIDIIQPTIFTRIGWRTYFVRELGKIKGSPAAKLKMSDGTGSFDFQGVILAKQINKMQLRLEVGPLKSTVDDATKALLFDLDISEEIKKLDTKSKLTEFHDFLRSDDVYTTFEELLKNG